jgi:hypothetical protein
MCLDTSLSVVTKNIDGLRHWLKMCGIAASLAFTSTYGNMINSHVLGDLALSLSIVEAEFICHAMRDPVATTVPASITGRITIT